MEKLKYLLFVLIVFFAPLQSEELAQESENFFSTFLFEDFHSQLKSFVVSEKGYSEKEIEYISFIETFTPGTSQQNRAFYHEMIDNLRLLIQDRPSPFLDRFCVHLFESVQMWDSLVRFQKEIVNSEEYPDPMAMKELFTMTEQIYNQTLENDNYKGCHKASKETNDQMRFGNFPYYLFNWGNTKVLRIPCITKDVDGGIVIVEEFDYYLKTCKRMHKKLLYVNLITQKYDKPDNGDPKRRRLIESLEQDPVFVLTLDQNSPFYFQKGIYAEQNDAEQFMDTFLCLMLAQDGMFTFPQCFHRHELHALCQRIHIEHFKHKSHLSLQERQDFIHLLYIEVIKKTVKLLDIDIMNISCVNTVDRGIALLSELYLDQIFEKRGTITKSEAEHFTSLILIHPIVLRNRPAHDYRLERVISASQRVSKDN